MTDQILVNSSQNTAANTVENFYTSPSTGSGTKISAFTATNNTTSSKTYKAYLYDASGAVIEAIVPLKIIVRDQFDLGAALIGQIIQPGGSLRMESSDASSIAFRVTGSEL